MVSKIVRGYLLLEVSTPPTMGIGCTARNREETYLGVTVDGRHFLLREAALDIWLASRTFDDLPGRIWRMESYDPCSNIVDATDVLLKDNSFLVKKVMGVMANEWQCD